MSEKDFPKKITKDNIQQLREKAKRIKEKSLRNRFISFFIFFFIILFFFLVIGSFYLMIWLAQNHFLDFILWVTPNHELRLAFFIVVLFTVMGIISIPTLVFAVFSTLKLARKYWGYPKHEELIFADCFIIAGYLMNNERMKAKQKVGSFLANLTGFVRDWFNPRRKMYAPEFNSLRSGKSEICRMLIFSKKKTPKLLMNFGLAFVRNDDPEAFSYLKQLVKKVGEYGEPKGRVRKFLARMERYNRSLTFILSIIIFVFSLLLTIFGYRPPT